MAVRKPTAAQVQQAFALFKAAMSYEEIARQVDGLTVAGARDAVARAIKDSQAALDPDLARVLEVERLDSLHKAVWAKALRGDVAAIDRVLRIQESRERLVRMPDDMAGSLVEAFETSVKASEVEDVDAALIATGRRLAFQIDTVVRAGKAVETTKALYLVPHLMNVLRELGATPTARAEIGTVVATTAADAAGSEVEVSDFESFRRAKGSTAPGAG